jgi:hypothetical protein
VIETSPWYSFRRNIPFPLEKKKKKKRERELYQLFDTRQKRKKESHDIYIYAKPG